MGKERKYNGGQWTSARYRSFIISALRSASTRWGPKNECIKNARVRRGVYKCELCKKEGPATLPPKEGNKRRRKNIVADHIQPIVDPTVGFVDFDTWIARCFVEADGYQALCHDCHTKKTNEEKAAMKLTNQYKKDYPLAHNSWRSMRARCLSPVHDAYDRYGGRGVTICKEWQDDFWQFLSDMGDRPSEEYSLDRIDNDGDYTPENCRWANRTEQANNRRNSLILNVDGEERTLSEWCRDLGLSLSTVQGRLSRGTSPAEALSLDYKKKTRPKEIPIDKVMGLHSEGIHFKEIAEQLGYHPDTIRKAIRREQ